MCAYEVTDASQRAQTALQSSTLSHGAITLWCMCVRYVCLIPHLFLAINPRSRFTPKSPIVLLIKPAWRASSRDRCENISATVGFVACRRRAISLNKMKPLNSAGVSFMYCVRACACVYVYNVLQSSATTATRGTHLPSVAIHTCHAPQNPTHSAHRTCCAGAL